MFDSSISTKSYAAGTTIFSEGDKSQDMYIILQGAVEVYKVKKGLGDKMILGELGPGQVFGEMSMISGETRSATAEAKEDTEVKVINVKNFKQSSAGVAPWVMSLAKAIVYRLRHLNSATRKIAFNKFQALANEVKGVKKESLTEFGIDIDKEHPDVLYLKGFFMENNTEDLNNQINIRMRKKVGKISLDFSNIIDIDQEAIDFLVHMLERLKKAEIELSIQNIQFIHTKIENNAALRKIVQMLVPPTSPVPQNRCLINQGDESDCVYVVEKGRFSVSREIDGKEEEYAKIGVGDVIGEMALISGGPRTATVRALTLSRVYKINSEDFHRNVYNTPKWFMTILKQLVNRVREAGERFDDESKNA